MKRINEKILSIVLSAALIFTVAFSSLAAVSYPQGITEKDALLSLEGGDKLICNGAEAFTGKMLSELVSGEIYSDKTASELLTGIYSALQGTEKPLMTLGVDVSVKGLSERLASYPEVSKALKSADGWDSVKLDGVKWGINGKESLAVAVGKIFSPFNNILNTLLNGGTYGTGLIRIPGDYGYEKGVISMLSALGCTEIASPADFSKEAQSSQSSMIKNIALSLFSFLDDALNAPLHKLSTTLPVLADYIKNGGLECSVNAITRPLTLHIGDYVQLFTGSQLLAFLMFIQEPSKYTLKFSENITMALNDMLKSTEITLPEIDLDELISLKGDEAGAFTKIMLWLIDTLKLNSDKLMKALSESEEAETIQGLSGFLDNILSKSTDEIFSMLVSLFTAKEGKTLIYEWKKHEYTKKEVTYTENLGKEKFQRVLDGIDDTVNQFMVEMGGGKSLEKTIKTTVYSNNLLTELVKGLYGAFSGEEMKGAGGLLGLPATPRELSEILREKGLRRTGKALSAYSSFDKIKSLNWGFYDGNKKGFINALTAVLSPLRPALEAFLANGTVSVLDSVKIGGTNGYNTAVIPLLEALGCSADSIKTYGEYVKGRGTDKIISDLLVPVTELIDRLSEKPVATIAKILPNILFFADNGSLMQCLDNLLYPVTELTKELGIDISSLGVDLNKIKATDIISEIEKAATSLSEDIKLPKPDLRFVEGLGELNEIDSKRTFRGEAVKTEYVKSDETAVLVTLLRYVVGLIGDPENGDMLGGLMSGGQGGNAMFDQYSSGIGDQFAQMSTDETIEWLYKLFFRERATVETTLEEYIPTVLYVKEEKSKSRKAPVILSVCLIAVIALCVFERKRIRELFERISNNREYKKHNREG